MTTLEQRYRFFRRPQYMTGHDGEPFVVQHSASAAMRDARLEAQAEAYGLTVEWPADTDREREWVDDEVFNCECQNPRCIWRPRASHWRSESDERRRQIEDILDRYNDAVYGCIVTKCADECERQDGCGCGEHSRACIELDALWGIDFFSRTGMTYRELEDAQRDTATECLDSAIDAYERILDARRAGERATLDAARAITVMIPA